MAALLTNMEDLEGAYKTAMDAEGSAYRENEAYLNSIQGRVDLFTNAVQTLWMNLISSNMAKGVVDLGTKIIQFLDTAPGKISVVTTAVLALLKATKGFDAFTQGINTVLGTDFKKSKVGTAADVAASGAASAKTFVSEFSKNVNKNATGMGISKAIAKNVKDTNTKINMRNAVASALGVKNLSEVGELTSAQQKQAASAIEATAAANKLGKAQTMTTMATSGLASVSTMAKTAMSGLIDVIKAHPFIAMASAVLVAVAALDKLIVTSQEASEASTDKFNEISSVYDTTKSNISSLKDELSTIKSQISDMEGRNLSFTDAQELQRLKDQRASLENNLSIQQQLLEAQEKVKNEQAVTAMKDFVKASNAGAESAKNTGKAIGVLAGGLAAMAGIALAPVSLGTSMMAGITIGGAIIGGSVGGELGQKANAATIGTYEDWYKTYQDAYKEKSKAAAEARKKYEKDPGDMKKYDKWQELEQESADVQSKMYDNLTQMQNYYSGIKYGQSKAMDKELDAWNNFLDKMNIDQNGAGAKVNALDRIFGENASSEVKAFEEEIDGVIKKGDESFDIAAAIEGRDDLQELEDQLAEIGITTDEVSDYFRKTGEVGTEAFSDLSGEITAAKTAMTDLQNALSTNTNEGYETRNTALEEMKTLMEKGAIGSESNLWNVAKAMGFTYDSAKTIEANADELYKYIKVRDDWYKVDDNGEWGISGAENFAKDIEKAVKNSKELQDMDIKWNFDEATGTLDFDFNNMQFDDIVKALSKTKEAAGLTNEEFIDMLTHIGQFYDVQWTNGNDIVSYLEYLETTSASAKEKIEAIQDPLKQLLSKQNLKPKEIEDYLTGNGSLKKLPKDLQEAVAAYRKLRDETKKPVKTKVETTETKKQGGIVDKVKNLFSGSKPKEKEEQKEESKGGILNGALTAASVLSMFGLGALGKGKKGKFQGPANSLDNKGLLKSLSQSLNLSSLFGKGKNLFSGLFGKGSLKGLFGSLGKGGLKGAIGTLGKGAFKVGSKFLGPIGWIASAATTIGPMLAKSKGVGNLLAKGKSLFSGLFNGSKQKTFKGPSNSLDNRGLFSSLGKGAGLGKILSKLIPVGLGAGALATGIPWLSKKLSGNKTSKESGKSADISAKVNGSVDQLDKFAESAKTLSKLDKNIAVDVTANVHGNVLDEFEFKLNNLKVFADSAKDLKNIGVITSDVTANVDGNVIEEFEFKLNNLKTFADSAKGLKNIGMVVSDVTANVHGNVIEEFEYKLNNLKTFSDSARDISKIGDATSNVTANVYGNVINEFEYKLNNLKTFTDSAKDISKIGDVTSNVTANVEGNVIDRFEFQLNNLKTFTDSAKDIKNIGEDAKAKVTAEIDGDVIDTFEYKIDNLKKFSDSARDISSIGEDVKAKVTAEIDGDVIDTYEYKIDNLKKFTDSAKGIKNIGEDTKAKVTAEVDGDVIDTFEYKIDNLKKFSDSAKDISKIGEDTKAKVTAEVDGDVIDTFEYKIDNLKKFSDSAKDISKIGEDTKAKVTAEVDGDVIDTFEYKIDNLKKFSDSAKDISKIGEDVKAKVTANVSGDVIDTFEYKIDNLKKFSDSAKDISKIGEDVKAKVTANVDGDVLDTFEYKIDNLKKFSDSAKDVSNIGENVKAKVTAEVDGDVIDTFEYKIDNLKKFTDSAKGIKDIGKNVKAKVTAEVDGSVLEESKRTISKLKTFTDSAKDIKNLKGDIKSKVTADVDGTVLGTSKRNIEKLKTFSDSAKNVKGVGKNVKAKVTADVFGNVIGKDKENLSKLKTFADSAKNVSKVGKNIQSKVTASISGDITDEKVSILKRFASVAEKVASIPKVVIKVSASIATKAIETGLKLLQRVSSSGLFKNYNAKVNVKANVDSSAEKNYKPGKKGATVAYSVDSSKVNAWKAPPKTGKVTYTPSVKALTKGQKNKTGTITYKAKVVGKPGEVNGNAHLKGNAFAGGTALKGGKWGAKKTETALTGELGQELIVRGNRWFTVGDQGAEFTNIQKGDIIFNHKQTEEIFKNGFITSRGKIAKANGTAHADGTAYASGGGKRTTYTFSYNSSSKSVSKKATKKKAKAKKSSDYSSDFEEIFDWFEVKMEEINEQIDLMTAKLENAITLSGKHNVLDDLISINKNKLSTLDKGLKVYNEYAKKLLGKIPKAYRDAAQNGKIAIEEFAGKTDEKTLEAIKNYREWAQKAADVEKQLQEVQTELSNLGKQKFDAAFDYYDVRANIEKLQNEKLQAAVDYDEERGEITSSKYYEAMAKNTLEQIQQLTDARQKMQATLDEQVKAGNVKKYDANWYEMVNQMYEVDASIDECTKSLEEYQNAINDIYWDNFDELVERLDNISGETENLIGLMDNIEEPVITPKNKDGWSADEVVWSKEGMAQLGLYAQQMEIAEYQAKKYEKAINDLNAQYKAGRYSESEYLEKLNELKDAQYGAIDSYYEAQDAMVSLHEARVDAIKDGIDKEISAYEKLINKKQEELDAEKDLYDFQKSVNEQRKDISKLERQIAALSGDNSASARAKRKKLEAELAEANANLQDTYYNRSIDDKQTALDKELESFQEEKDKEIEKLEEYLEDTKRVVADTLGLVQENAFSIYDTLQAKGEEYGLTLSDHLLSPWQSGMTAISDYQTTFDTAISATIDKLGELENAWQSAISKMGQSATSNITEQNQENARYEQAEYVAPPATSTSASKSTSSSKTTSTTKYYKKYTGKSNSIVTALKKVGVSSSYTNRKKIAKANGITKYKGTASQNKKLLSLLKKGKLKKYASGSKYIDKDQLALIDELGEELVIQASPEGKLQYLTKGSGVIPADLTSNLMDWGELNPQDVLDRNRPSIAASPEVHATEINLNIQYGDMLRIDNFKGDNPDEIAKIVAKQFEKHTAQLNQSLRKYVR